jgi:hypothetical protein
MPIHTTTFTYKIKQNNDNMLGSKWAAKSREHCMIDTEFKGEIDEFS